MKNDTPRRLTILISSPDSYNDVFNVFIFMLQKHWPDCPYEVVLANETLHIDLPNVRTINCGLGKTYFERQLIALPQIDSEYVFIIVEDALIGRDVLTKDVEEMIDVMQKNALNYYRLYNSPHIAKHYFDDKKYLHRIPQRQPYGIGLMANIWKKEHYTQLIQNAQKNYGPKVSGWEVEIGWLKGTLTASKEYHPNCVSDSRNLLGIIHGVTKGKWFPSTVKKIRKHGYEIDLKKRNAVSPSSEHFMSFKRVFGLMLPPLSRYRIKKILSKFGFKFSSDY